MAVTFARSDILRSLMKSMGCSRTRASYLLETTFSILMDAFSQEKTVKVVAFGTFIVRKKAKRMGRNPKTKEEVTIGERHTLVFKPSKMLKDSFQNTVAVAA